MYILKDSKAQKAANNVYMYWDLYIYHSNLLSNSKPNILFLLHYEPIRNHQCMKYKYFNHYKFYNRCGSQHNASINLLLVRQSNLNCKLRMQFLRCSFDNFTKHWQQGRICILCLMTKDCIHQNIEYKMNFQNIVYNNLSKLNIYVLSIVVDQILEGSSLHHFCSIHHHRVCNIGNQSIMYIS